MITIDDIAAAIPDGALVALPPDYSVPAMAVVHSLIRAKKSGHATIYVLDAITGKELWSSGDTITSFNHFSGITVANREALMVGESA